MPAAFTGATGPNQETGKFLTKTVKNRYIVRCWRTTPSNDPSMTRERIELNGHDESYNPSLDRGRARPWSNGHSAARISAPGREDISAETFDFESQDEAQFLRTEKRVPVR